MATDWKDLGIVVSVSLAISLPFCLLFNSCGKMAEVCINANKCWNNNTGSCSLCSEKEKEK